MKVLTKDVLFVVDESGTRLWHECAGRREMFKKEEDIDTAKYKCRNCGFSYVLDKHFNLKNIKPEVKHEGVLPEPEKPKKRKRRFLGIF